MEMNFGCWEVSHIMSCIKWLRHGFMFLSFIGFFLVLAYIVKIKH